MKYIKRLTSFLPALLFLFTSVASASETAEISHTCKKPIAKWSAANKDFTANFYPLAQENGADFVFSPLSLQLGMALSSEIALGDTQNEILKVVSLPTCEKTRHKGAKKLFKYFNTESDILQISLANAAWISTENKLPKHLKEVLKGSYQAGIFKADFVNTAEETRLNINTWVADNTQQMIQNLLTEGSVSEKTKFVLVNTLYLKAPWKKPFSVEKTYDAPFYTSTNKSQQLSFMHQTANFGFLDENDLTVIELPFKADKSSDAAVSLFVVLPKQEIGESPLAIVEKTLTAERIKHLLADTKETKIDLSLPKFKVSSALNAKDILKKMGLSLPFTAGKAEFDVENNDVVISDILHNAVFEIDEVGGTGAAATGVVMNVTCVPVQPKNVVVNRPFLIFVADKSTGIVLFAGRITLPTQG